MYQKCRACLKKNDINSIFSIFTTYSIDEYSSKSY